ncbi:glycosyltransferase family 87 protein [Actinospongicola halichondriae]|uniref:glycosyltransferase family 87 protein n=1 Tax=Actinospongicola halichondriae TaxID=3236844 RepID=UPI003D4B8BD2
MGSDPRNESRPARRSVSIGLVFAAIVLASFGLWKADVRADTGLPLGAHDFIQHSAAFDVAMDGENPYDEPTLRAAENRLFPRYNGEAQRFWYPPWILVFLAPVIALPFEVASAAWIVLTFAGAVGVVLVSWRLVRPDGGAPPPLVIGLALVFVPLIECLLLGQMGVMLALFMIGGLLALREGRDGVAGVLLALTMMRPQMVVLPLIVVGVHVISTGRWQVVRSSLATVGAVLVSSAIAFPSVWANWDPFGGSPTHFRTPTIATWVRLALESDASAPTWPLVVVPALAVVALVPWAYRRRNAISWQAMPLVLGISVVVSPYAWVYDSMLLMPIHVALVAGMLGGSVERLLAVGAIGLQLAALVVRSFPSSAHEHQIIVPLGLLLLYAATTRIRPAEVDRHAPRGVVDVAH